MFLIIALTESKMRKKQTSNKEQANEEKKHTHLKENQQFIGLKANLPTEMVIGSWIVMSFVG